MGQVSIFNDGIVELASSAELRDNHDSVFFHVEFVNADDIRMVQNGQKSDFLQNCIDLILLHAFSAEVLGGPFFSVALVSDFAHFSERSFTKESANVVGLGVRLHFAFDEVFFFYVFVAESNWLKGPIFFCDVRASQSSCKNSKVLPRVSLLRRLVDYS